MLLLLETLSRKGLLEDMTNAFDVEAVVEMWRHCRLFRLFSSF
jgi:hypothetical protein